MYKEHLGHKLHNLMSLLDIFWITHGAEGNFTCSLFWRLGDPTFTFTNSPHCHYHSEVYFLSDIQRRSQLLRLLNVGDDWMTMEHWWNDIDRGKPNYSEETCLSTTSSFQKFPHLSKWIHSTPHSISLRSILMLSFHLLVGLPTCFFPSGFHTKTPFLSPIRRTCPRPPNSKAHEAPLCAISSTPLPPRPLDSLCPHDYTPIRKSFFGQTGNYISL
jgi:hypothetical protein